jgi:hypothetical protein
MVREGDAASHESPRPVSHGRATRGADAAMPGTDAQTGAAPDMRQRVERPRHAGWPGHGRSAELGTPGGNGHWPTGRGQARRAHLPCDSAVRLSATSVVPVPLVRWLTCLNK